MNYFLPITVIIMSYLISNFVCKFIDFLSVLKIVFKIKFKRQANTVCVFLIIVLIIATSFLFKLNIIDRNIINSIGLFLGVLVVDINSNLLNSLKNKI
ncbi:hypothetical protein [Clostridium folliculivorans]|uniref:Uncharacterized protein n=1 Tax=Clostridium folliculivorans TaxID=2886038 RepID=A0A9W5Y572_9CLOT|nr:hypothetical protein [Clostridium folliculivorans]GKU26782.1 hypothetical protein CFOLD11_36090 [Clostridium folliculivorans]GKU31376.1 hypothetical protein CFB3_34830 [Clostridium folliculivorans]